MLDYLVDAEVYVIQRAPVGEVLGYYGFKLFWSRSTRILQFYYQVFIEAWEGGLEVFCIVSSRHIEPRYQPRLFASLLIGGLFCILSLDHHLISYAPLEIWLQAPVQSHGFNTTASFLPFPAPRSQQPIVIIVAGLVATRPLRRTRCDFSLALM